MPIVRDFAEMVLVPANTLIVHAECWGLLCTIVDILSLGDAAVQHAEFLRTLIEKHHDHFITIYGSGAAFPKFHYMLHLPDVLLKVQHNLSCFTTERKHRLSKTIGARIFRSMEQSLVQNVLADTVKNFKDGEKLQLERLEKNNLIRDEWLLENLRCEFPSALEMYVSTAATVEAGEIRKGNICLLETALHQYQMFEVLGFVKITFEKMKAQFLVHAVALPKVGAQKWQKNVEHENTGMYPACQIKRNLAYAPLSNGQIRILETIHTRNSGF